MANGTFNEITFFLLSDLKVLSFDKFLKEKFKLDPSMIYDTMITFNNKSITHQNVQHFLKESNEKYDLAILEWLYSELNTG